MSFERNFKPAEAKKTPEKRERILNFIKEFCGYEVAVGVEKGDGPIRADINTITKKAEVFITPEGIKAAYDFYKKPETQAKVDSFVSSLKRDLKRRIEKTRKEIEEMKSE